MRTRTKVLIGASVGLTGLIAAFFVLRKTTGLTLSGRSVVALAKAQIGLKEFPKGSNGGPDIVKFTGGRSEAWCAHFISWLFRTIGKPLPGDKEPSPSQANPLASVTSMENMAKANGFYLPPGSEPREGDVIFMGNRAPNDTVTGRHVAMCIGFSEDGKMITSEGNFSDGAGSRKLSKSSPLITGFGRFPT